MAKYVFKPISDSSLGSSRLTFQRVTLDESASPNPISTDVESSVQVGDLVYALTKQAAVRTQGFADDPASGEVLVSNSSGKKVPDGTVLQDSEGNILTYNAEKLPTTAQKGYSISDFEMAKVIDVTKSEDNQYIYIDIDKILKTDVYGTSGSYSDFADQILFERNYNKINEAKIGFDRDAAQLVETEVTLSDTVTGQNLQDSAFNDLITTEQTFFEAALKSGNATSVSVNNDTNVGQAGGPVSIAEQFPTESETSSSLLGVPRAETQLSLFSDVSTLGLEESNWEVIPSIKSRLRYTTWENRASEEGGNRYISKLIENTIEQALELSSNNAPYSYPWPEQTRAYFRPQEWAKFRRWLILGNILYERFKGTPIADRFLDPSKVRLGTTETPNLLGGGFRITQRIQFGTGVSEEEGFRLIDIWTVTWQKIGNDDFSSITQTVINSEVLVANSADIKSLIGDATVPTDDGQIGVIDLAQFPGADGTDNANKRTENRLAYRNELVDAETIFTFGETQPGYLETDDEQQVVLQSKEAFRYQPGRISGFTFGSRTFTDPRVTQNVAEWGVVNDTDEYIFQTAGPTFSIVRRSTVPLEDKAIELSTGIRQNQVHVNSDEYKQSRNAVIDLTTGVEKPPYYELKIPSYAFNIDSLDGNGPSGYSLDLKNVTMWKIEFSWYGAIGVVFYAYIPVGDKEARWIKVHRIVIENTLGKACLEDPYFKMRYLLKITNRTQSIIPQYIYKYGSSVYIDGGDEGTKRPVSFTSNVVTVPEDQDTNPNVADETNRFTPIVGLLPKKNISNVDGISRKNRIISYPESLTVDATELVELDFIESTAGNEYGFTYDDGLVWNRDSSPRAVPSDVSTGASTNELNPSSGTSFNKFLGHNIRDDSPNSGRTIDVIYDFETTSTGALIAYKLQLVTTDDNRTWRTLSSGDDSDYSPFISIRDHDAKLVTPGLNGYYIDYHATVFDSTISAISGNKANNTAVFDKFRVKRIGETNRGVSDPDGNGTLFQKLPINEDYPIIVSSASASQGSYRTRFEHTIPDSPYYSFNSPYGGGYQVRTSGTTFRDDFKLRHRATHPDIARAENSDGTKNLSFPFIKVAVTDTRNVDYVDKSVIRNHSGIGIIPYSSLFGAIKVHRKNDAVCSSSDGLNGAEIICRFLNPHAGYRSSGLNRRIDNGVYSRNVWPEFSVGFTPYPPSSTFKDDATFTVGGVDRKLEEKDFIAADYTHCNIGINTSIGVESYYGETMWQLSGLMRDNFRMRAIPNELDKDGNSVHDSMNTSGAKHETDTSRTVGSFNSQSPSALNFHIGGYSSFVKLSIDERVKYNIFEDKTFDTFATLKTELNANIGSNFNENIYFPDFPNLYESSQTGSDLNPFNVGINDTAGTTFDYMIIEDDDFETAVNEGLKLEGGSIIKVGSGDTGHTFASDPIKVQYYVGVDAAAKQAAKTSRIFNGSGYLVAISNGATSAIGTIEQIAATFVKLEYPNGVTGTINRSIRKLFGSAPKVFYPYIRLRHGGQMNSINYLQKAPNEGGQVATSVSWQVFGGAKVHQPLLTGDNRYSSSLRSGGAPKDSGENFNRSERLSGISADVNLTKPLRTAVSEPDFKCLSDDETQNDRLPGGVRINTNLQNKLAERAKKLASFYFGNNITTGNNKHRTATISLNSIFGEDRAKILPDEFGNKALFLRSQKVNLEDADATANVKVSININEI